MNLIFQEGFWDDHLAYVYLNGKWKCIPMWMALEWQQRGSIRAMVNTYGNGIFNRVFTPHQENEALYNIEQDARALMVYYSNPSHSSFRRILSTLERLILRWDRKIMAERPVLATQHRYQVVAEELNRRGNNLAPRQIEAILHDATAVLRSYAREREVKKYMTMIRDILRTPEETAAIAA